MGQAVRDYDGTGDYTDHEVIDATGAVTLVAVLERDGDGTWDAISTHQTSANVARLSLAISSGNRLQLATNNGTSAFSGASASGTGTAFTVTVADSWCIVVASFPAGTTANPTLSKYTPGGGWVHITPTANMQKPASHSTGKLRLALYENTDDGTIKLAAYAEWVGTALSTAEVETLDGGDRQAWKSIAGGYTDLIEPAVQPTGTIAASWATNVLSEYGLMDQTGNGGNGTIVTGDLPPSGVYTVGVVPADSVPVFTVDPVVSGTVETGETLTCSTGTVTGVPAPTMSYQWQRDNTGGGTFSNISAATSSTYVLVNDDLDCMIRCVVTATNTQGSDTANSNQVGPSLPSETSVQILRLGNDLVEVPEFVKIGTALVDPITEREWAP